MTVYNRAPLTISFSSSTDSDPIALKNLVPRGIRRPASMSGTSLTPQWSPDGGATWLEVKDRNNASLAVTIDSSAGVNRLDPDFLFGFDYIRFVSSSSETAELELLVTEM